MPAPTPLHTTAPEGRCYCRDRISPEKRKRRLQIDPELPDRTERRAGDSRYCCLSVKHQNGVFTLFPSRPNPPREIPTCEELGPKASAHYVLDLCLLRYLLFHPAGQQEPTEGTEAEAIRVNARENRVTAAAGVSPKFAPSAPLGGHGRSWPRKGSGGAGFEQEDLEVRENVKTWETSESRKAHSCKFVSLRG